ncbi:uncharacterized protein A4U43_C07F22770 [Asparagus officinalis]|uniref:Uncharacterized protein n=1 Tax=Asparagus officinalis TaxID=4686 RepID=A0A5P1EE37_ASPOF|nr:uncharacterized protein A4U43_C07F22770 [Asparagus officinalis]
MGTERVIIRLTLSSPVPLKIFVLDAPKSPEPSSSAPPSASQSPDSPSPYFIDAISGAVSAPLVSVSIFLVPPYRLTSSQSTSSSSRLGSSREQKLTENPKRQAYDRRQGRWSAQCDSVKDGVEESGRDRSRYGGRSRLENAESCRDDLSWTRLGGFRLVRVQGQGRCVAGS